jgi:hypothetical protein
MIRTGVQRAIERLAMGQLVAERRHHRVLEIRAGPEIPAACALTLSSQGRSRSRLESFVSTRLNQLSKMLRRPPCS